MKFIVIDTETTGINRPSTLDGRPYTPKGEVIQVAALVCDEHLEVEKLISFYCMPTEPIADEARDKAHGIHNSEIKELSSGKFLEDYLYDTYRDIFLPNEDIIFVGHNIPFDIRAINNSLLAYSCDELNFGSPIKSISSRRRGNGYIDTMRLGKEVYNYHKFPKLSELVSLTKVNSVINQVYKVIKDSYLDEKSFIREGVSYHDAAYDVCATWASLKKMELYIL